NQNDDDYSLIDFNRSGVPLVEIVTEPDFENAQDVKEYLQRLQQIVRYLEVSDADMEKGNMRLEPNISLARSEELVVNSKPGHLPPATRHLPPYKVEVKNINSFSFVSKAIEFEIKRHTELLDKGETPAQETRGFVESSNSTVSQRSKEDAKDYRYFPEPDIPPLRFTEEYIAEIACQLPELPQTKIKRFIDTYALSIYDAEILVRDRATADFFDKAADLAQEQGMKRKELANYIINKKPDLSKTTPEELVKTVASSNQVADVDEAKLSETIDKVLVEQAKAVTDFKKGKETVIMFLVGQVMRQFPEKIDAGKVKASLLAKLK
ncbi:MAG: hypothetical protein AAB907_01105, partial [Patescibacteria group bacterium]